MAKVRSGKFGAIVGSALFFVVAPCVMGGVIPWWITDWWMKRGHEGLRYLGAALIVLAVPGLVDSFVRFAVQGLGTPAPAAPTRNLVVTGLYRYTRNPMYVAVAAMIFGQALLYSSPWCGVYGAAFWLVTHIFVVMYEEPALSRQFPEDYPAYKKAVPRWLPRLTPWRKP
ncbi:methyltransferase family protein [Asticcacaulis sp. AC460]|uniref:methyltransferase family protein n=1 Tax=Asticcacaulis sp. AC460 TaxID=1282360 RepID=UPI0004CE1FEC|nr:isoprenylcysteine carboxylmethyltransferase family protein [Asticcacaulis sp. AC460]